MSILIQVWVCQFRASALTETFDHESQRALFKIWQKKARMESTSYLFSLFITFLLLLSCVSCVQLCATPQTAAHKAPPSLGFSRQEHWSGLPFPSPLCESEVAQSRPTCSDPMDCSLRGFSIHGIFQARVLEWLAIAFST